MNHNYEKGEMKFFNKYKKYIALLITLIGALLNFYLQHSQLQLQKSQLDYKERKFQFQKSQLNKDQKMMIYSQIVDLLPRTFIVAYNVKEKDFEINMEKINSLYYSIEPFLNGQSIEKIRNDIKTFDDLCRKTMIWCKNKLTKGQQVKKEDVLKDYRDQYEVISKSISDTLHQQLFNVSD